MPDRISRGSISRLHKYETCARQAMFAYVERIPEPPRPALAAGKEYPNDRGDRVHRELQSYVESNGRTAFPKEAKKFEREYKHLLTFHTNGAAKMEEPWLFDDSWRVMTGPNAGKEYTYQVRLDVSVALDDKMDHMAVIDFKTGKRFGNEVKHSDQLRMYALGTMVKYPMARKITTELHYLDHDEITQVHYSGALFNNLMANYTRRFETMFNDSVFRPKPNAYNCGYCPFKTGKLGKTDIVGTGHCRLNP